MPLLLLVIPFFSHSYYASCVLHWEEEEEEEEEEEIREEGLEEGHASQFLPPHTCTFPTPFPYKKREKKRKTVGIVWARQAGLDVAVAWWWHVKEEEKESRQGRAPFYPHPFFPFPRSSLFFIPSLHTYLVESYSISG